MSLDNTLTDLVNGLTDAMARIATLERQIEQMHRPGTVTDVDAAKHRIRTQVGVDDDGKPVKGPWVPYSQVAGGANGANHHQVPVVGQQMLVIAPGGDLQQGLAIPFGWSNDNPSPSTKADETVDSTFGSKVTRTAGGGVKIEGENLELVFTKISMKAGEIYGIGKVAMGVDSEQFPAKVLTEAGPASKLYAKP